MKYATKKKRNGETPYIDPYATNPCRQVYGKKCQKADFHDSRNVVFNNENLTLLLFLSSART